MVLTFELPNWALAMYHMLYTGRGIWSPIVFIAILVEIVGIVVYQNYVSNGNVAAGHIICSASRALDRKCQIRGSSEVVNLVLTLIQAEEFAMAAWHRLTKWKVPHFQSLPQWLQDNDFLHFGHRPPLPTSECFKSIVRIHTETGNIWTHLLGVYES